MRFSLTSIFTSLFIASTLGLPTRLPGGGEGLCTNVPQGLACIVPCSDRPRGYCITISATGISTATAATTDVSSSNVASTVTESSSTSTTTQAAVSTAAPVPTDSGNDANGTDSDASGRDGGISIGTDANGEDGGIGIGTDANGGDGGISIGADANGGDGGIAIGSDANGEEATGADGGVVFPTSALPIPGNPVITGKPGEAKPGKPGIVIGKSGEAKPGKPGIVVHHYKY